MNYADIKTVDIQDGTGVRVSIYVSGCHFHCKGCHNEVAWDFNYGKKFDDSTIDYIIDAMKPDFIAGLSLLGGEPMELVNQQGLVKLVEKVKEVYPEKTIWCYTGYKFEEDILNDMYKKYDYTKKLVDNLDIIVDGQFIEEKKMVDLKFRGSTNQNKIDVQASLKAGKAVKLEFGDEKRYIKEEVKEEKTVNKYEIYKEFIEEKLKEAAAPKVHTNNIVDIDFTSKEEKPAFDIKEVEEKVAAKEIGNKDKNNL